MNTRKKKTIWSRGGHARAAALPPSERKHIARMGAAARWKASIPERIVTDRGPVIHELKTWSQFFDPIARGLKTFEVRKADRDFQTGDGLRLREVRASDTDAPPGEDSGYTGREFNALVTYTMRGPAFGLKRGWVIMAIVPVPTT